jgi:hypothetical protein
MFDRVCTACHKRQLIFPGMVTGMANTEHGIVVTYTCWCGADQAMLTGRAASEKPAVVAAA